MTNVKLTYEFVKAEFEKRGCILLSEEYVNNHTKLEYLCPNGCLHETIYNDFKKDRNLCPRSPINYEKVKKIFEEAKYILLSKEYITAKTKLNYRCPENHIHQMTFQSFNQGQRCPTCQKRVKLNIEFIRTEFAKVGYTLTSETYINNKTKLDYVCNRGHKHSVKWNVFQQGCRCIFCEYEDRVGEGHINWKGGVTDKNLALFSTYADKLGKYQKVQILYEGGLALLGVACTYCGKIFAPKASSVQSRLHAIEGRAEGEQNLYCSEECKRLCPTHNQILWPKDHKPYKENRRPVQAAWAKMVKTRDNFTCRRCGTTEGKMIAHHIDPVINNPIESADVDNGITYCKACDKLAHKTAGCTYQELHCKK